VRVTIPENVTKRQVSIDFKPQRVTLLIQGEQVIHGDVEHELDMVLARSRRPWRATGGSFSGCAVPWSRDGGRV
jgi:hypothetical protein